MPKYDAILIDEGQDFEPEWLRLLTYVLNPETQSLLLVEDRAQNIFRRTSLAQDIGLDFRGRSKILSINYRNTAQIVQFAWDFYRVHSKLKDVVKEGSIEGVDIIPPQATKRKGPDPVVRRCTSFTEEMNFVSKWIKALRAERNIAYSDIAILYRVRQTKHQLYIDVISRMLQAAEIPSYWLAENQQAKRTYNKTADTVTISTMDSAKGLDFRVVFIVNIDNCPFILEENVEREVSLLYIGMTRALEWLFLTYSGQSAFTDYLDRVVSERGKRTLQRVR